jgi:hypothetical protein
MVKTKGRANRPLDSFWKLSEAKIVAGVDELSQKYIKKQKVWKGNKSKKYLGIYLKSLALINFTLCYLPLEIPILSVCIYPNIPKSSTRSNDN